MTPERWQQIEALFHSALECAPASRADFLDEACRGDLELRRRIDALLEAHESAGTFIEEAPMVGVLSAIANQSAEGTPPGPDPSLIGRRIGHYQI
ncbi:MAG TPA: hypothetical protein VKD91_10505, partial [Pyrinomonadaceae bacterium]|nr:hypothetical protein [Pyrinomonadaceae bacterium]